MAYASLQFTGTKWLIRDGDIYVSRIGSDDFGTGAPLLPYTSIQKAVDAAVSGQKIVVGTGYYNEAVDGGGKNLTIQADGKVFMEHSTTGTAYSNMGSGTVLDGFLIRNYQYAVDGAISFLSQCTLVNSGLIHFGGTIVNCILSNLTLAATAATVLHNDTFIGTISGTNAANENQFTEIYDCHFDPASVFDLNSMVTTAFDFCNQQTGSVIKIDGNNYTSVTALRAAYPQYQQSGITAAPGFNVPASLDYSLSSSSALLHAGRFGRFIGARGLGYSLNNGVLAASALTNIILDSGSFKLQSQSADGTIETPVINLGRISRLGDIRFFAGVVFNTAADNQVVDFAGELIEPNHITYQIRYGTTLLKLAKSAYKYMVWDKVPTYDSQGNGNGETDFDFNTQHLISAQYVQIKITLKRVESFYLVQENTDCLLQESGDNIIWKY